MPNHWPRKRGKRFRGDFDRARNEELIVRLHEVIVRRFRTLPPIFLKIRRCLTFAAEAGGLDPSVAVALDKTDVAAAFDTRFLHLRDIVVAQTQAHVLFDIVGGDMITAHCSENEIAIFNDYFR
jgi:hypothetical protein